MTIERTEYSRRGRKLSTSASLPGTQEEFYSDSSRNNKIFVRVQDSDTLLFAPNPTALFSPILIEDGIAQGDVTKLTTNEINNSPAKLFPPNRKGYIVLTWTPSTTYLDPTTELALHELKANGAFSEREIAEMRAGALYRQKNALDTRPRRPLWRR